MNFSPVIHEQYEDPLCDGSPCGNRHDPQASVEWCICPGFFGLVMALSRQNTAVNPAVDLVTSEYKPLA